MAKSILSNVVWPDDSRVVASRPSTNMSASQALSEVHVEGTIGLTKVRYGVDEKHLHKQLSFIKSFCLKFISISYYLPFRLCFYLVSDRSVATIQQHNDYSEPLFIGLVRILQTSNTLPPLTIMQAVQDEYVTQHTTTGTIIQTDHRIAVIAGYLSGEVTGMSAYDYVYGEDLEYTLKAQKLSK